MQRSYSPWPWTMSGMFCTDLAVGGDAVASTLNNAGNVPLPRLLKTKTVVACSGAAMTDRALFAPVVGTLVKSPVLPSRNHRPASSPVDAHTHCRDATPPPAFVQSASVTTPE